MVRSGAKLGELQGKMVKGGKVWLSVAKCWEKWGKVGQNAAKCRERWQNLAKGSEMYGKVKYCKVQEIVARRELRQNLANCGKVYQSVEKYCKVLQAKCD